MNHNNHTLVINGLFFSVDVFFYLGGFFVAYAVVKPEILKNFGFKRPGTLVGAFLHRVIRILPCYAAALFLFW